jgi:hypothetical protein
MPSQEQIQELRDKCSWQWTQLNGVKGRLFTGPNGNTLFLPAAGGYWGDSLSDAGSWGVYWSRTLNSSAPIYSYYLFFYSGDVFWHDSSRSNGHTVRAVRVPQN